MAHWKTRLIELAATVGMRSPRWRSAILQRLAGSGDWEMLFRVGAPCLPALAVTPGGLEPMLQAAHHTGRARELWQRLADLDGALTPQVDSTRQQLQEQATAIVGQRMNQCLDQQQSGEALDLLRDHEHVYGTIPLAETIRLGWALVAQRKQAEETEVFQLLNKASPHQPQVATLKLAAALRDRNWPVASEIYNRDLASVEPQNAELRYSRIRILVNTGQAALARELLERERTDGLYPQQLLALACVLRSEHGEVDDLYQVAIRQLAEFPPNEQVLSVLVRAARKTGQVRDLWERLNSLPRPLRPEFERVQQTLLEDLTEAGTDITGMPGADRLQEERADRIRLKIPRGLRPSEPSPRIAILYCADAGFLRPAWVSLVSLCLSNPLFIRKTRITLATDTASFKQVVQMVQGIGPRLGVTIDVLDAAEVIPDPSCLRSQYGFFTGGAGLSPAAYYRIFLARHLLQQNHYEQALYLDADTLIRPGLSDLFDRPQQCPLMARPEVDRPEIRQAVAEHQLAGWYFNSGVLRLDFRHHELAGALDRSLHCALDPLRRLHFHDQCALNVGFDSHVEPLPERFNHFVTPEQPLESHDHGDAVVLHFVSQPKPWDNYYPTVATSWFESLQIAQNLLGDDWPDAPTHRTPPCS